MPTIEIPDISIREIYIPDVPEIYTPHYITITEPPEIDAPGCTYQHRDIKNTGNRNLLLEDPNGVFTTCDFPFPSFVPLDYSSENLVIVEEVPMNNSTPDLPKTEQAEIPKIPEDTCTIIHYLNLLACNTRCTKCIFFVFYFCFFYFMVCVCVGKLVQLHIHYN